MTKRAATKILVFAIAIAALALPAGASAVVPSFSLSSPTDGQHVRGSLSINGYSSNVDITATCSFTNVAPYSSGGDCTYLNRWVSVGYSLSSSLAEGSYQLTVTAKAADGSNQTTTINRTYVVDKTGPTITYNTGPRFGNTYTGTDFSWSFSANESGSVECKLDDEDWAACSSPYSRIGLTDGAHTLRIHSTDDTYPSGNTGADAVANFTVNNAPPEATIQPIDSPTASSQPSWSISVTRPDAHAECRIDAGSWSNCDSGYEASVLDEGSHTLEARAYLDGPTQVQDPPSSQTFDVDLTSPEIHFLNDKWAFGGYDMAIGFGSTSGDVDHYSCTIDGDYYSPCESPAQRFYMPWDSWQGDHSFQVWATDNAGNESDAISRTYQMFPDLPDTQILTKPDPAVAAATATFTFSSDTGVEYQCSIDGGAYSACPTPFTVTGLAEGQHTLSVRAMDPAEQLDDSPATAVFKATAPVVPVTPTKPTLSALKLKTKSLSFSVSAPGKSKVTIATCKKKKVKGKSKTTCRTVDGGTVKSEVAGKASLKLKKSLKKKVKYRVTIVFTGSDGQKKTLVKTVKPK